MKPVSINPFDITTKIADSLMMFGAATIRAGPGKIKAALNWAPEYAINGIAVEDKVERNIDGFFSKYDPVPLITAGRCRVWVTSNNAIPDDLEAGNYLELAILGTGNTLPVGIFEEARPQAGHIRDHAALARALDDLILTAPELPSVNVAIGDTEVTMNAAPLANLDLTVGDYIILEDMSANVQANRVADLSSTKITLQLAANTPLTVANGDRIHRLDQCEVLLL